jgi:integrase/recombinase XerC
MIDTFLQYLKFEKRVSPHTLLAYQKDLYQFQSFLSQTFSEDQAELATHRLIRSWIINLTEEELEPQSINRKIACLRSFYKFLQRQEVISINPMLKIRVLKTKKGLPSFVKESEMAKLLDSLTFENTFDGWRDKIILELFYSTGIRLSELIHLKDRQVDIKGNTIKVLGKRNKERIRPFPTSLVTIIETYRSFRDKEVPDNKSELLLVTEKGEPCYPVMIYRIVKNYLNLYTTTDKRSPHVLRHSYATHLLNKGAEINAVKDLLGHSSLAATQVYTHNSIEKLKKAFDKAHPTA